MSEPWSTNPGAQPPALRPTPPGWEHTSTAAIYEPPTYGSGPPLPPLPPPEDRSKDRLLALVAAILVVLVLIAAGIIVLLSRPPDQPVAAGPGASTTTTTTTTSGAGRSTTTTPGGAAGPGGSTTTTRPGAPTTTVPAGPPPTQAEIDAVVAEISVFVETTRGLTFKQPVKVDMVSDEAFIARLLEDFEEDKAEIEETGRVLKALGLADPRTDIVAAVRQLLGAGVLGFYDPESKALVIRGQQITPFTRETIAHELVHALDDQHFELNRPQYDTEQDEIGFGLAAVAEGNARRIQNVYVARMTSAEKAQRESEEARFGKGVDLAGIPPVLLKMIGAPYDLGEVLVKKIMERGGNDILAQAFTDPPRMSAAVMHPDRFFAKDKRIEVAKPKADSAEQDEGVFGELMTRLTLEAVLPTSDSAKAGDGWGGDWYVTYEGPNEAQCIRIDYKMITPADLDELKSAYTKWGSGRPGVTVEMVGSDLLEVTSCTTAAASGGRSPA